MSEFELVTLRNGQRAVRHLSSGEVMHPSVGPWAEANALYVDQLGLREALKQTGTIRIYDVGLGAGTNALAALSCARELGAERRAEVEIISFERDLEPLELAAGDTQGFAAQARFGVEAQAILSRGEWDEPGIRWRLLRGEFLEQLKAAPKPAQFVFFDPFSPQVNPSLWTVDALEQLRATCDPAGALVATYSAATPTRVSFLLAGFFVGVGAPIGTKSETTVASTKVEQLKAPLGPKFLARWERSSSKAPHGEALTPHHESRLRLHPQLTGTPISPSGTPFSPSGVEGP